MIVFLLLVAAIVLALLGLPSLLVGVLCWWDNYLDRRFRAESPDIAAWEREVRTRPGLLELVDEPYNPLADAAFHRQLHAEARKAGRP